MRYNILQAIYMSFYSADLYRDVARNWGGKAILYLLFVLALSWIPITLLVQIGVNHFYNRYADDITAQIPVMELKEGKLKTPENRPYIIKSSAKPEQNLAVIDTSAQYTNLDQANAFMLVTDTEIIYRNKGQIAIEKIPNVNHTVEPQQLKKQLSRYLYFIWLLFFIAMLLLSFIYRLFQAVLYSILGKIFASIMHVSLAFSQVMQIVMVALTPAIIISMIFDVFSLHFPMIMFFYFILSMIYLIYGIRANRM